VQTHGWRPLKDSPTPKGLTKEIRPLQGRVPFDAIATVGFTHGYSMCSPLGSKAGSTPDDRRGCEDVNMEGVQFIVDSQGRKSGVLINLKKHGTLWEDIYDNWLAEKRKHEPREALRSVRRRLERRGKLK